jgi:hypothetical protein
MSQPALPKSSGLPPRVMLLACQVFESEIALHAAGAQHIVATRFFEVGLHDRPDHLRAMLQSELDSLRARDDIEAVILAYGLCGRGAAGLCASHHKLVLPRAHDCIAVFMGSRQAYGAHHERCPTCFYYTPGWNRCRRVPGPERLESVKAELAKKFSPDDVEFLLESERALWKSYDTATYLDLGTDDAEAEADYARRCADWLGWKFERLRGDTRLLRDLLWGNWDADRFQIVEPGQRLIHSPDESILGVEPAS